MHLSKSQQKRIKTQNKALVEDDRWKKKGGPIKKKVQEPRVCPECNGLRYNENGFECWACEGVGEIWN